MSTIPTARQRPVSVPNDLDDSGAIDGVVQLPQSIRWSGEPIAYDLANPRHLRSVYEQVLREGTEDDVRRYVRATTLIEVWDELFLPGYVRARVGAVASHPPRCPDLAVPLSPLQERVALIVAALSDASELGLAGGAALIVWGIGDRVTRDLDFFATRSETVDALAPVIEHSLRAAGLGVEVIRSSPGFVRLEISDRSDVTEVDLAWDFRMRELRQTDHGLVLERDELAADKVLALYGRAEARDFVDVYRLRALYTRQHLCDLAFEKDAGFHAPAFAAALDSMTRRDRIEFDIDDATFEELCREFAQWRQELESPSTE